MSRIVTAEIKTLHTLTIFNRCYFRGSYFAEDDWSVTLRGETTEELVELAVKPVFQARNRRKLNLDRAEYYVAEYLVYGDKVFMLDDSNMVYLEAGKELFNRILEHPKYKVLVNARKRMLVVRERLLEKRKKREKEEAQKQKEEQERAQLEKLLKKYPRGDQ